MALAGIFHPGRRAREAQLAHALRGVPLFREMPADDLVAIWRRLREAPVPAGSVICKLGDPGDSMYVVQAGQLEVRLGLGPAGVHIRLVSPGDFVGEMALLTGEPRSADIVAVEDSVLWALDRAGFEALLAGSPSLLRAINRALCYRVDLMTRLLAERETGGARGPAGLRFGPYRVLAQLGAGGMAVVYSAVHVETEAAAAVKVLPACWGASEELRERLRREAEAVQMLHHPNVVRVHEVGHVESRLGGGCYLAMEWLPNGLDRVLRAQYPEPLAVAPALRLAHGVADALASVHAIGLIHRDVKPSNIMLRADGTPVLTDFGLVVALAEASREYRLTPSNVILGTADYLPPEHVAGLEVDGRSDLYSLGVVLYEMLAGYVPFAGREPLETLRAHVEEPPPPLPPEVPQPARAVVERALRKRPEDRFSSACEMADSLAGALAQVGAHL